MPPPLYLQLKQRLLHRILDGSYADGDFLPAELDLVRESGMSRVTVRKALSALKQEGVISSQQGQGTRVTLQRGGVSGSLDMVALIANVLFPWFVDFYASFEPIAERHGSLVVFKQDRGGKTLADEDFYLRLLVHGIRHVVLWPLLEHLDEALLERARGVGMNLVIFDQPFPTASADVVSLDNRHAIGSLYRALRERVSGRIDFLSHDDHPVPSLTERRDAFHEFDRGDGRMHGLKLLVDTDEQIGAVVDRILSDRDPPAAIICSNGAAGLSCARALHRRGRLQGPKAIRVATMDHQPDMDDLPMLCFPQPLEKMAKSCYQRLLAQVERGPRWRAQHLRSKGSLQPTPAWS